MWPTTVKGARSILEEMVDERMILGDIKWVLQEWIIMPEEE